MLSSGSAVVALPEAAARSLSPMARRIFAVFAVCFCVMSVNAVTADRADAMSFQWRWYGGDAQLNRNETNNLMFGWAGASAVAQFIPHPVLARIASGGFTLAAGYAGWIYNRGGCLKFRIFWNGQVYPAHYYGWPCR